MLRISSVWRIRQIKFQNRLKNASIFRLFYEILPGSEQLLKSLVFRPYCENQEFKHKQSEETFAGHTVHRELMDHCEIV